MSGLSAIQLLVAVCGGLGALAVFRWYVRREADPVIRRLIVAGLVAKLAGTAAYYVVIAGVYGSGDVTGYVRVGRQLALVIRSGTLPDVARETGTRFMEFLAGVVFAIFGPSEIVGYLVFSTLSFVGMLAFVKALQLAAPRLDHRRYAALVLLMPTMLFWPSTIGKDAWLVFTLGTASYGGARILRGARAGYPLAGLALAGMGAVRPHMGALFALAFGVGYVLRLWDRDTSTNKVGYVVGLVLIGAGVLFATTNFSQEQGRGESAGDSAIAQLRADADEIFARTNFQTQRGGGEFESRPVDGPDDLLYALVTVPFRPFPTEAHNLQAQLISLEGLLLFGLGVAALPRLVRLGSSWLRMPYVAFAGVYSISFVIAFSNVANFGILTRQRSQLLPFLFVLLAVRGPDSEGRVRRRARASTRHGGAPVLVVVDPAAVVDDSGRDAGL